MNNASSGLLVLRVFNFALIFFLSMFGFKLGLHQKRITNIKPMNKLKDTANQVRRDIVRMVHGVQSGHPGGSLGCTDFLTALYFEIMKHDPAFKMDGKGEDRVHPNGRRQCPDLRIVPVESRITVTQCLFTKIQTAIGFRSRNRSRCITSSVGRC